MKQHDVICSIATTLYPSYLEGLTSPASTELVETHLKECPHCQKLLAPGARPASSYLAEASYLRRYQRLFCATVLGVFLGVLLFALLTINMVCGTNYLWKRIARQQNVHTDSPAKYRQWEDYTGISGFTIFPEDLSGCKSVNEYNYQCDSSSILTALQLYLDCSYTPAAYEAEKHRLLAAAQPDLDQSLFAFPACYTMLFSDTACEYAIFLEKEQRILYISLENIARDEIIFDESYLPLDYGSFGAPPKNQAKPYCQYQTDTNP